MLQAPERLTTGHCCAGEGRWRRFARRFSGAAASVLPGAALAALPKCPLCLAAWLSAATGGAVISANSAEQVRWAILGLWIAAMAFTLRKVFRRQHSRPSRAGNVV
jgi:hypothetical protein